MVLQRRVLFGISLGVGRFLARHTSVPTLQIKKGVRLNEHDTKEASIWFGRTFRKSHNIAHQPDFCAVEG